MQPGPGFGAGPLTSGPVGTIRNPILSILSICFCCPFYAFYQSYKTEEELKRFLGKSDGPSILWFLLPIVPILAAPKLIAEARAKAGCKTQGEPSTFGYYFMGYYLLLKDANEIWESQGVQPKL